MKKLSIILMNFVVLLIALPAFAQSYVPGVVALDLQDDLSDADIKAIAAEYNVALEETSYLTEETKIHSVRVESTKIADFVAKLKRDKRVQNVEPVYMYYATGWTPNDPLLPSQWHMETVGAERAWMNTTGRGVKVAIVDTGVTCEDKDGFKRVSDLANTPCAKGYNFIDNSDFVYDDNGHGTHVAGTIAQSTNNSLGGAGLAFHATIIPVKVLAGSGGGTLLQVADGIRFAADAGANVINMSLGGGGDSAIMHDAIKYAKSKGVVVVVAAGNNGQYVEFPGAYPESFTVSATDENNKIANFSSRGPEVDIAAPGVNVLQQIICNGGKDGCEEFKKLNGTSMATPHVAGAAALIIGTGVTNPEAVEKILLENTSNPGGILRIITGDKQDQLYGAGVLNVGKAVTYTVWKQILTRLGFILLFSLVLSKLLKKEERYTNIGYMVGALVFGVGLLSFVPFVSSSVTLPMFLLGHPILEWDMLISASLHGYLPLATFIIPLGLSALFFNIKTMRPFVAGSCAGVSGYLASVLLLQTVTSTTFGMSVLLAYAAVNIGMCTWIAFGNIKK